MKTKKTKTNPQANADTLAEKLRPMSLVMRLVTAADLEGLTIADILRFPDLVSKYLLAEATAEDVAEASKTSRRQFEELVRNFELNRKRSQEGATVPIPVSVSGSTEDISMASFTVEKTALVGLLVSLGYKLAAKWPEKRLLETVRDKMGEHEEGEDCSDPGLLKKLIKAVNKEVEVVLSSSAAESEEEAAEEPKPAKKAKASKKAQEAPEEEGEEEPKPAKKSASKAKPAPVEEDEYEDEDEEGAEDEGEGDDDDEADAEEDKVPLKPKKGAKPAKGAKGAKKAAKSTEPKKPGVIATIFEIVQTATAKKPLSRDDIFAKLVDAFPDRDADALKSTVQTQVPSRIAKERGVTIEKNEKGYWIAK